MVRVWDIAGNVSEEKARHRAGQNAAQGFAYADAGQGRNSKHQPGEQTAASAALVHHAAGWQRGIRQDALVFEVDQSGDYDFFVY